jgi:hypothetical protein
MLPLVLVAWLCQGCFILDEIDAGNKILDQHSPNRRAQQEAPAPTPRTAAGEEEGFLEGAVASVKSWWKKMREPAAPQRDPDDGVVRCTIGNRTQFTRKSDCIVRGGRIG